MVLKIANGGTLAIAASTTLTVAGQLIVDEGGGFTIANAATLTVTGSLEAGPYQIFDWTGTGAPDMSGSPTSTVYFEWWGAQTGTANDATAAINKTFSSIGSNQTIKLLGWYRSTSAITAGTAAVNRIISLEGSDNQKSALYIDIGGTGTGYTFGTAGSWSQPIYLRNMAVVGPPSCCEYGMRIYMKAFYIDNVNFFMGASGYALRTDGCEVIHSRGLSSGGTTYFDSMGVTEGPAGPLYVAKDAASGWTSNSWDLDVHFNGGWTEPDSKFTKPFKIGDSGSYVGGASGSGGDVIRLTGSLENYTVGLDIYDASRLIITSFYMEGGGTYSYLTLCTGITIDNVLFNDSSMNLKFDGCRDAHIQGCRLPGTTTIEANCLGFVFGSNEVTADGKIVNNAGDTQFLTGILRGMGVSADNQNLLHNATLSRWTASAPANTWTISNGSFTQCGTGLADTTRHKMDFSARVDTNGGNAWIYYNLDADQLKQCLGKLVTWSLYAYVPDSPQSFDGNALYLSPDVTVPAWSATTAYALYDGVKDGSGNLYICMTPGTSGGSAPSWPATPYHGIHVTDGTVVWAYLNQGAYLHSSYSDADVGSWKLLGQRTPIPANATAARCLIVVNRQTGAAEAQAYLAEPCLRVGGQAPQTASLGQDEVYTSLQLGALQVSADAYIPTNASSKLYGKYARLGDICYNDGSVTALTDVEYWRCTVAGTNGTDSTWTARDLVP